MQQRSVQDLMRIRHGLVVQENSTLREVAERLIISDCDLMAVTDKNGKLAGVICESSIVRALLSTPPQEATIQSIIIRHAESVRLDACISTVQPLFRSCANTALPVVDADGCVCGLLMRSDVIRSLLNQSSESKDEASIATDSTATQFSATQSSAPKNTISAFKPPRKLTFHEGVSLSDSDQNVQPGPHFLKADAARQVLWAAEDRL